MERKTNIDVLYEIALDRLSTQVKTIDGADTKIGVIFGLTNGLIATLGAFVVLLKCPITWLVFVFIFLTGVSYVIILLLLYGAYRWGKWVFDPDLETLKNICTDPQYHDYPEIVKEWVADECIYSLENNKKPLSNKVQLANRALIVLSSQGIFLVASFISYLFS